MVVLLTLLIGTALARIAGWAGIAALNSWPAAIAVGLALMFLLTGLAHFAPAKRAAMIAIVPPELGSPAALVTITGVLELLGALGLLLPATRPFAATGLALLLVAMFPANVRAARMPNPPASMTTHLGRRTLEQVVYVAAAVVVAVAGFAD